MNNNSNTSEHSPNPPGALYQVGKWGAIAIIVYYLLTEHRAHVIEFLPYIFLLACPLMHIFMHKGHGHHHHHDEKEQR